MRNAKGRRTKTPRPCMLEPQKDNNKLGTRKRGTETGNKNFVSVAHKKKRWMYSISTKG